MSLGSKWTTIQQALVGALDKSAFDDLSLGLVDFPSSPVAAPACLQGAIPQVECGVAPMPEIAVANAGTAKSMAALGVRHDVAQYVQGHMPQTADVADSSPIYGALAAAFAATDAATPSNRAVLLVTDGGGSCASLSSPTRPGISDGMCPDWEYPTTISNLLTQQRNDPTTSTQTFVIGLPGSDSDGQMIGAYTTAPYSMLLALSTYAVAGSPATVDPTCDWTTVWAQTAPPPAHPCQLDLSNAAGFNATTLASTIATARERAFGCVYDLSPPMGQTIDPTRVNVVLTADGTSTVLPRRQSATDTCSVQPCWDYDAQGRVTLIGAACDTLSQASAASVDADVGCPTVLK
jgi:hypothetical protein